MTNFYLSIIIPAYNEENRILDSLDKLYKFIIFNNFSCEILIVDDGSIDKTISVVNNFFSIHNGNNCSFKILENISNKGKGFSVRKGFESASGKYVLFTDADLSTPIEESKKMLQLLNNGYDIVIGSRALADSKLIKKQNIIRMSMGKFFNFIVKKVTGLDYKDTQCGFKMFTKASKDSIFPYLKINDFSFDVEILYIAKKLNLKVKEMPISWINSPNSKVRILNDSLKMLLGLRKIKKLHSMQDFSKINF